jgi:Secretion system C-terminal sorting domain/Concanavalin A-like lectin/glucanases superfamily
MKKQLLAWVLAVCMWLPLLAQNLSTGIDALGNSVPVGGISNGWSLSSSPYGPSLTTLRCASYLPFWQATPIAGTNAGWINYTGGIFGNLPGIYVFERQFNIAAGTASFSTNFRVTWDDVLVSLELVDPSAVAIPLTVVPTAPYQLSQLVSHVQTGPAAGTWRIRATINFIDNVGAFMLSGDVQPCKTKLPPALVPNLIAYYPFTGGSLTDFSGNGLNLTNPTMVPVPATDRAGYANCAYQFFGGWTDFLTTTMPAGILPSPMSPWSVALWYKPRAVPVGAYQLLFGRLVPPAAVICPDGMGELSVGLYDCLKPVARTEMYSCWDQSVASVLPNCNDQVNQYVANGWQHLAVVNDPTMPPGARLTLYRNGIVVNSSSGPCGPGYTDMGDLFLGLGYSGLLDDVMFYSAAIPTTQVYQIMLFGSTCCTRPRNVPPPNNLRTTGGFQVYPNPTTGSFHLLLPEGVSDGPATVEIYDWRGKCYHNGSMTLRMEEDDPQIDLQGAPQGVYLLKLTTGGQTYFSRFTKE